jgi:hypothetical protein
LNKVRVSTRFGILIFISILSIGYTYPNEIRGGKVSPDGKVFLGNGSAGAKNAK